MLCCFLEVAVLYISVICFFCTYFELTMSNKDLPSDIVRKILFLSDEDGDDNVDIGPDWGSEHDSDTDSALVRNLTTKLRMN